MGPGPSVTSSIYTILPPRSFRLLTILPPSSRDPSKLTCQLSTHPLASAPPYTALSYTWGSPYQKLVSIHLGNHLCLIRQNLYQALYHIRCGANGQSFTLWADAICINQDDLDERMDQVSQMHAIYKNACDVLVWLGLSTPDSSTALDFVLELPELLTEAKRAGPTHSQEILNDPLLQDRWTSLGRLLTRPWWRRVWIIQEISFARSARLLVGMHSIPWSSMHALLSELKHSWQWALHTDTEPDVATIIRLASTSRSIFDITPSLLAHGHTTDLGPLLKITHLFKSSDPRDKIYALLGLTDVRTRQHIPPDYRKSSLSWTSNNPDPWFDEEDADRGSQTGKSRKLYATGDPALAGLQPTTPKFTGDTMTLSGVQVDRIASMDTYMLFDLHEYSKNYIRMSAPEIVEKLKTEADAGEADAPYIAGGSTRTAFYRTLLLDCAVPYVNPQSAWPQRLPKAIAAMQTNSLTLESNDALLISIPPKSASEVDLLLQRMQESLKFFDCRCFATTGTGYVGVVPRTAKPGDWVCALLGGEMPFVLRDKGNGQFRLIGECYLHGIMDGEVMEELKRGKRTLRDIVMR
ncbi:heterokaryon incompatibility protein-domain-containing protein [Amylocystis lapponica]|nr:heterokaryon incompatibility protein-domain-containing protein [Amylocystis lapponica]